MNQAHLFKYLLRIGDDALISGHRLAEWCSKGPILEEDLAMTNLALDYIGRSAAFLKYAGEVEGKGHSEDDLAYRRGERQFYNHLLVEMPRGNFAYTVVKQLFYTAFEMELFTALIKSTDPAISALAVKALKEVRYHFNHARDWSLRLSNGTELSHSKMQEAVNQLWMYTGELFEYHQEMVSLVEAGIAVNPMDFKNNWILFINAIMGECKLNLPTIDYMQTGSYHGVHTEHLGHLLSEMQYLQRAYPDAKW